MPSSSPRLLVVGILCGLGAALIWGGQSVLSRQAIAEGLTAIDITLLRFLLAGAILLPWTLRRLRPFPVGSLGWPRALILTVLVGAPYSTLLVGGSHFAPALHTALISPGLIPVMTALLAFLWLGERPGPGRLLGLALILVGLALFSWDAITAAGHGPNTWIGDLLFVLTALLWSVFGLLAKRWKAPAFEITAATCVLSAMLMVVAAPVLPLRIAEVPLSSALLQAVYQGALVGVGALFLYSHSVTLLGPAGAVLFLPLVPVVTAVAGFLLLGEAVTPRGLAGMALVMAGMGLALTARR